MTTIESTAMTIQEPGNGFEFEFEFEFDEAQLAVVSFLARYSGRTLEAYRHDLRGFFQWATDNGVAVLAASRAHIELLRAWMETAGSPPQRSIVACRRSVASTGSRTSTAESARTPPSTSADPRHRSRGMLEVGGVPVGASARAACWGNVAGVGYPVVQRLRIGDVLTAMASVGAPVVSPVRPLAGGAVGAWEVARSGGASSVLTWRSSSEGHDRTAEVQRVAELVAIARTAGVPAPRYEDIIPLPDGSVVVLQELVEGVRPTAGPGIIAPLLDLIDRRRGLLLGPSNQLKGTSLYLTEDGPGFCLHGPLRDHDKRTRRLLDWIETVGRSEPEVVVGADVVHFDHHLGNVLVAPDDPSVVVAIVDWDGVNAGDVAIDGVNLALDLVLYDADAVIVDQVADHLRQTTPEQRLRAYWAHGLLRLVDWRLRHSPQDDLAWMQRAEALARV